LESWNDDARPVAVGEEGDMVITKPFPNMPIALLGDDGEDSKLKDTYFNHYPGKTVWYQGDFGTSMRETRPRCLQALFLMIPSVNSPNRSSHQRSHHAG
jgi:acyl-coenzyme A synthetase/AMP-(fatty) acid ligase